MCDYLIVGTASATRPHAPRMSGSTELIPTAIHGAGGSAITAATVDIVIPVFNEERALPGCIAVLHAYLDAYFPFDWTITVVDNASTDGTRAVAEDLIRSRPRVRALFLDRRGKGRALRAAWTCSQADVVVYMDVDLSTGLDALLPLVAPLVSGHSDIAIGSRLAAGARTVRRAKRDLISRGYNALLRLTHGARFSDAQCGFKAARGTVIRPLLGHVTDDAWFFDTELLLLAEHNGLRVHEVPVDWVEDVDSRVRIVSTATGNFRGLVRIAVAKATGAARVSGLPVRPAPRSIHPDATLAAAESPALAALAAAPRYALGGAAALVALRAVVHRPAPVLQAAAPLAAVVARPAARAGLRLVARINPPRPAPAPEPPVVRYLRPLVPYPEQESA
jgi:hypothetical protein